MKVYIGPYKNFFGVYHFTDLLRYVGVSEDHREKIGAWLSETWINDFCEWVYSKRRVKVKVKIHDYDTWSADTTLALIILPMLLKLRENGAIDHAPYIPEDQAELLPEDVRKTDGTFERERERWGWIINEMIWAFEQIQPDSDWNKSSQIYTQAEEHQERITRGLTLFGRYYQYLWW